MTSLSILELWLNPIVTPLLFIILRLLYLHFLRQGNILRFQSYANFWTQDFYIGNPALRTSIENNEPIPVKIWCYWGLSILIVMATSILFFLDVNVWLTLIMELILGVYICGTIDNTLQSLSNVYLFKYYLSHPDLFIGQVKITSDFQHGQFQGKLVLEVLVWCLLFLLIGRVFFFGGVVAAGIKLFQNFHWQRSSVKTGS